MFKEIYIIDDADEVATLIVRELIKEKKIPEISKGNNLKLKYNFHIDNKNIAFELKISKKNS